MKKMWKVLAMTLCCTTLMTGCGNVTQTDSGDADKKTLVVWTFTDEIEHIVNDYYLVDNPDLGYDIEVRIIPNEQYQSKLDPALSTGKGVPDVISLEGAYAKKYINSGYLASLSSDGLDLESALVGNQYDYVLEAMRGDDGVLRGATWQAAPGAFYYRRSIAKEYLGTDDPAAVQEYLKDFDTFLETARKLYSESNGKIKILSSFSDLYKVFYAARSTPWVVDNKLVIDPKIEEMMDMTKILQEEKLTNETTEFTEGWFSDMSGDSVFGYFLPSWGLSYVLKQNATNVDGSVSTAGDWAVTQGPAAYYNGGTWVSVYENSPMKEEAKDLVEYIATNEDFLKRWAEDTGDFVANKNVVNEIKDGFSEDFLQGQNHYALFAEMADDINADIVSGDDLTIGGLLSEQVVAYARGEKDKETALADFKQSVINAFPNYTAD